MSRERTYPTGRRSMSTGSSVRSLSAISLAMASMGVLGRQKATSVRITSRTAGLAASGASRLGSRLLRSAMVGSAARAGRRGLLLGEPAEDVLPGLGGGLGLEGGARQAAVDPRPGPLDLAVAALVGGAAGGAQRLDGLRLDGGDRLLVVRRAQRPLQPRGRVGSEQIGGVAEAVAGPAAQAVELAAGLCRLGHVGALRLLE